MITTKGSTAVVGSLDEAKRLGPDVTKVEVVREGAPKLLLLRREADGKAQGFALRSRISSGVKFDSTAIVVDSVVDGNIEIGEGVILERCQISGAGKIRPNSKLVDYVAHGADPGVEMPI